MCGRRPSNTIRRDVPVSFFFGEEEKSLVKHNSLELNCIKEVEEELKKQGTGSQMLVVTGMPDKNR